MRSNAAAASFLFASDARALQTPSCVLLAPGPTPSSLGSGETLQPSGPSKTTAPGEGTATCRPIRLEHLQTWLGACQICAAELICLVLCDCQPLAGDASFSPSQLTRTSGAHRLCRGCFGLAAGGGLKLRAVAAKLSHSCCLSHLMEGSVAAVCHKLCPVTAACHTGSAGGQTVAAGCHLKSSNPKPAGWETTGSLERTQPRVEAKAWPNPVACCADPVLAQ